MGPSRQERGELVRSCSCGVLIRLVACTNAPMLLNKRLVIPTCKHCVLVVSWIAPIHRNVTPDAGLKHWEGVAFL